MVQKENEQAMWDSASKSKFPKNVDEVKLSRPNQLLPTSKPKNAGQVNTLYYKSQWQK